VMTAVPGPPWSFLRLRSSSARRAGGGAVELSFGVIAWSVVLPGYGAMDRLRDVGEPFIPNTRNTIIDLGLLAFQFNDVGTNRTNACLAAVFRLDCALYRRTR
jgi:hypothetical protein